MMPSSADVPPTGYDRLMITMPRSNRDHWPDVPPDPPAAEVGAAYTKASLEREAAESRLLAIASICDTAELQEWRPARVLAHIRDALSSGVLVDAADVRARAQEAAWDEGWSAARQVVREQKPGDNPYRRRAVSEREATT